MPELLVLEVVRADLDSGSPLRRALAADVLEVADQLLLLGVDRDHRLACRERRLRRSVDVAELRVAVGMLARPPGSSRSPAGCSRAAATAARPSGRRPGGPARAAPRRACARSWRSSAAALGVAARLASTSRSRSASVGSSRQRLRPAPGAHPARRKRSPDSARATPAIVDGASPSPAPPPPSRPPARARLAAAHSRRPLIELARPKALPDRLLIDHAQALHRAHPSTALILPGPKPVRGDGQSRSEVRRRRRSSPAPVRE